MSMNKQAGNMYGFVTHTWNTVKGKCPHDCSYCYMKRFPQNDYRFVESELKTDLGEDNIIFVGSSNDMWADGMDDEWIRRTLKHCKEHPKNTYLFQSKNPERFKNYLLAMPDQYILCTTIETNTHLLASQHSKAPGIDERAYWLRELKEILDYDIPTMLTIEPIMKFELDGFISMIDDINPKWINIGADSGNNNLTEPTKPEVDKLISYLQSKYNLTLKDNLKRLLKE